MYIYIYIYIKIYAKKTSLVISQKDGDRNSYRKAPTERLLQREALTETWCSTEKLLQQEAPTEKLVQSGSYREARTERFLQREAWNSFY